MCPFLLLISVLLGVFDLSFAGMLKAGESLSLSAPGTSEDVAGDLQISFSPPSIDKLFEGQSTVVEYNITACCHLGANETTNLTLSITPDDARVARVSENSTTELIFVNIADENGTRLAIGSFRVEGKRLGKTLLKSSLQRRTGDPKQAGSTVVGPGYRVIVLRKRRVVDDVFRYGLIALACILYIGFGCKIDLKIIASILRRPISPAIGFCCQFILMPLLGFGISRMLRLPDELSFGLLAMAASPGGGSSNVWVSLLGGDLDLSLTMTTISTFGSLGMMPLWMYLLGRFFVDPKRLSIPYMDIFRSLLTIVIPCLVGLLIKRFLPKPAEYIARFTRPFSGIFVLYILTFGTYVNVYMYIIMATIPMVIVAAILLPLLGYSIAFVISLLLRRTKKSAVAIAIETGVQNASIPIIMLQGNFQQPEGDLGAVMPVATSLFTQFPIMFAWLGVLIYRRVKKPTEEEKQQQQQQQTTDVELSDPKTPPEEGSSWANSPPGTTPLPNGTSVPAQEAVNGHLNAGVFPGDVNHLPSSAGIADGGGGGAGGGSGSSDARGAQLGFVNKSMDQYPDSVRF